MKLGEKIDLAFELRERKRELDAESKQVGAEIEQLKLEIREELDQQGTLSTRSGLAAATITETVVPHIADWDEAVQWIMDNEATYLIRRQISAGAYRDMLKAGDTIPGIEPFTKREVSLRKLSKQKD